jgi:hypothetical protein
MQTKVFTTSAVSQATYASEVAAFPTGLTTDTHNFLRLLFLEPLNFSDDAQWATIAANAGRLAAATRASGRQFDGLFIDNEYYGSGNLWDNASPTLTRQRGKQVGAAIAAAWPDAVVLLAHGPYVSDASTASVFGSWWNNVAWANEGIGPFDHGVAQGMYGTPSTFIDGGEVYGARSAADFATVHAWQKTGLADSGSSGIITDPAAYKAKVTASTGVYDRDDRNGFAVQTPAAVTSLLRLALASVDRYAWFYSEVYEWGPASYKPTVPQAYIDAVAAVK